MKTNYITLMKKYFLYFFILIFGINLSAATKNDDTCSFVIQSSQEDDSTKIFYEWAKYIGDNAKNLKNIDDTFPVDMADSLQTVKDLKISIDDISEIIEVLPINKSFFSEWVLKIKTLNGEIKLLKIYRPDEDHTPEKFAGIAVIQNTLAKAGFAPKISGILPSQDVELLQKKFPNDLEYNDIFDDERHESTFGILMDFVEGDFIKNSKNTSELNLSKQERLSLHTQISKLEDILTVLRILPYDLQFIIDTSGEFKLIDLDFYYYISPGGVINNAFFEYEPGTTLQDLLENLLKIDLMELNITPEGGFSIRLYKLREMLKLPERSHENF